MIKIIGLGNRLRGDDAIGPEIIDLLQKKDIPIPLQFIEAGSDAFTLLHHLSSSEPMIIVDAANMGSAPGTVKKFDLEEPLHWHENLISLHGFSFAEVLNLARTLGPVAPCKIIAVQPESIEFGQPISRAVKDAVPEVLNLIIEEASNYAEKNLNY